MTQQTTGDDTHRDEGVSVFEWPLTADGLAMDAGRLLDELLDTIITLNRNPEWNRTLLPPRFGDIIVDREHRTVSARLMWKTKPDYRMKGTMK
ncbi:hypothetical protein [Bifidobacterium simiiventris]|uniref:hypothetical protein n=1 Tax=Bifidobacterium simiiventris TaxID=2834434 RepID=UPI001C595778|nr:hypothetical protein [Bifidobacterium simiiventris]MBW3077722.1 hypothetical protein [Bifidobacterium simiiventris]